MRKGSTEKEGLVKYFLAQRLGSLILLILLFGQAFGGVSLERSVICVLPMIVKAGLPPFHVWLIRLFQNRSYFIIIIIRSAQKVLPTYLLLKVMGGWTSLVLIIRFLVGRIGLISQVYLKKFLGYSSVLRVRWVLGRLENLSMGWLYLAIYTIALGLWGRRRGLFQTSTDKTIVKIKVLVVRGVLRAVALLSIRGVPPLLGFYAKLGILHYMLELSLIIIVFALIRVPLSTYSYLRFGLTSFELKLRSWGVNSLRLYFPLTNYLVLGLLLGGTIVT